MEVSGQRHAPAALYPRRPFDKRLGGPQSRSGGRGYKKNPLPLSGIEPRLPDRPARSQTLYCLSYRGPHLPKYQERTPETSCISESIMSVQHTEPQTPCTKRNSYPSSQAKTSVYYSKSLPFIIAKPFSINFRRVCPLKQLSYWLIPQLPPCRTCGFHSWSPCSKQQSFSLLTRTFSSRVYFRSCPLRFTLSSEYVLAKILIL
jgi:hypothetical protein